MAVQVLRKQGGKSLWSEAGNSMRLLTESQLPP